MQAPANLGGEKFRGSSEIPLTGRGLEQAQDVGIRLAQKGGLDEIKSSSLGRTLQTASAISRFTHAPITYKGDGLHPWHLGGLEGSDVTPEKIEFINDRIHNHPDTPVEGRGPRSSYDGESFNDFKTRTLDFISKEIHGAGMASRRRVGLVTHYRVKKLIDAWMRKGAGSDYDIDEDLMTSNSDDHSPGGVDRLVVDPNAGPQMFNVDLASPAQLGGGLYLIRHGETEWNNSNS